MKLSTEVVVSAGQIDIEATVEAVASELETLVSERKAAQDAVGPAVSSFFAANPGSTPMPTVASLTTSTYIKPAVNKFAATCETVCDYIRANADGAGLDLFHVGRGRKDGGVSLKSAQ